MRVRPGRERSLIGGIMALLVTFVGLAMLGSFPGAPGLFMLVWLVVGLGGAAASFYNAFSRRGLPLYEVDTDERSGGFCPKCGRPVAGDDVYCRHCGNRLR